VPSMLSYSQLLSELLELMDQLADDWEYDGPITAETGLFNDLGFESLDLVVLGTAMQEKYGKMPFAEFLAELGQHHVDDVSVGDLVDFLSQHAGAAR
jgi:acyl carrier protein